MKTTTEFDYMSLLKTGEWNHIVWIKRRKYQYVYVDGKLVAKIKELKLTINA